MQLELLLPLRRGRRGRASHARDERCRKGATASLTTRVEGFARQPTPSLTWGQKRRRLLCAVCPSNSCLLSPALITLPSQCLLYSHCANTLNRKNLSVRPRRLIPKSLVPVIPSLTTVHLGYPLKPTPAPPPTRQQASGAVSFPIFASRRCATRTTSVAVVVKVH